MLNNEINDVLDYLRFEFRRETLENRLAALEEKKWNRNIKSTS